MGSHLLWIDAGRPRVFEPSAQPEIVAVEPPARGFRDYLADARRSHDVRPRAEVASSASPDEERDHQPAIDPAAQSPPSEQPLSRSEPPPEVTADVSILEGVAPDGSAPAEPAASQGRLEPAVLPATTHQPQESTARSGEVASRPAREAPRLSLAGSAPATSTRPEPVGAQPVSRETGSPGSTPAPEVTGHPTQSKPPPVRVEAPLVVPTQQEIRSAPPVRLEQSAVPAPQDDRQSSKALKRPAGHAETTSAPTGGETLREFRVKEAIEQRRQGSTGGGQQRSGADPAGGRGASQQAATPSLESPTAGDVESATELRATVARGTSSDSTAASIARFVLGAESGFARAGGGAQAPFSASPDGAAPTSVATPAQASPAFSAAGAPVSSVEELFATGAKEPEALASAARVLRASNGSGRFQVLMQLHPPELGQLKLNIQMHQQAMTLQVDVQDRAVARLVESRLGELRDALASHGIRIDRSDIVVRTAPGQESAMQQQQGQTSGDGGDQQTSRGPGEWTPDGQGAGTSREHRAEGDDASGAQHDAMREAPPAEAASRFVESNEWTSTAELSLDLVA